MLKDAIATTASAAAVGVVGALVLARLLDGLLVETPAYDPLLIGGAAVLTICSGVAACLLPARRAARSNPAEALRDP